METTSATSAIPAMPGKRATMVRGLMVFAAGVVVGGVLGWYFTRAPQATPELSPSPSPSASTSPSPMVSTITFRTVVEPSCAGALGVEGQYMVVIDGKDAGIVSGDCSTDGPEVIEAGDGWAIVEVPPTGLGGYIFYGEHHNGWYVNSSGTVLRLFGSGTDVGFSANGRLAAFFTSDQGYHLYIFDLQTRGLIVSPILPGAAVPAQYGLPTFSPDASKIAFVVWYGPDNERGEIYIADIANPSSSFVKIGDTAVPPSELFWRPDGTVGWR